MAYCVCQGNDTPFAEGVVVQVVVQAVAYRLVYTLWSQVVARFGDVGCHMGSGAGSGVDLWHKWHAVVEHLYCREL